MEAAPSEDASFVPDDLCFVRQHWSKASTSYALKNELSHKAFALRTPAHIYVADARLIREVSEKRVRPMPKVKQP